MVDAAVQPLRLTGVQSSTSPKVLDRWRAHGAAGR